MARILLFNRVLMPEPKLNGFKISKNKIWSKNTGRNDKGNMIGTLIAIKRKLEVEWPILTSAQVKTIDSVVSDRNNPFVTVEYISEAGVTTTMTVYFGDVVYPIYRTKENGEQIIIGCGISAIEK